MSNKETDVEHEGSNEVEDDKIIDPNIDIQIRNEKTRVGQGDNKLKENSFNRYAADLRWLDDVLEDMGISATEVDKKDLRLIILRLKEEYNGRTISNRWTTLEDFYNVLEMDDKIEENPFDKFTKKKEGVGNETEQSKHFNNEDGLDVYAPSKNKIDLMVENVNSNQDRSRDQLLILLMYHTACRCDEIRKIRLDDVDRNKREIKLRSETTKNDKMRMVRYGESLNDLMYRWIDGGLRDRRKYSNSPFLFISQQSEQMSKSMVNEIVREAAKNAGINEVLYTDASGNDRWKITSHSLRHACATHMIKNGCDIYRLSKYLGHKNVEITQQTYVHSDGSEGVDEAHEYGPQ